MQLNIELKGASICVKYKDQILYKGERERVDNEMYYSLKEATKTIITVNETRRFLSVDFEVITYKPERIVYEFNCKSLLKAHWLVFSQNEEYEIITHRGSKLSIYKKEIQIANVIETSVSIFNSTKIIINLNKNENKDVIIGIALAFFAAFNSGHNTITFNIGHIGPEVKKFDKNWISID